MKRLGLDLGTNSLGWAIIDDEKMNNSPTGSYANSPIEAGVVLFDEGMDRDKQDNLCSRAAARRMKRAARRLIMRRKYRKFKMLEALRKHDMCPISQESINDWKNKGVYPIKDTLFVEWLSSNNEKNPYLDRKRACEEKVDKYTFGRALYHIAQRRGFKSSKKERMAELEALDNNKDDSSLEREGEKESIENQETNSDSLGVVKRGIEDLTQKIRESGEKTLGAYFYSLYQKGEEIRGAYTDRIKHYIAEFDILCDVQEVSEDFRKELFSIIFFQRPLRTQRHTVAVCVLEKARLLRNEEIYRRNCGENAKSIRLRSNKKRIIKGHPLFEEFSALTFLNNIKVKDKEGIRHLTKEERNYLLDELTRSSDIKGKTFFENFCSKFGVGMMSNYSDNVDIPIKSVTAKLQKLNIPSEKWDMAINAKMDFDDLDLLMKWAQKKDLLGLSKEDALKFAKIDVSEMRASYSKYAIKKIIPYLKDYQMLLWRATYFANIDSLYGFALKKNLIDNKLTWENCLQEILVRFEKIDKKYEDDRILLSKGELTKCKPKLVRYGEALKDILNVSDDDVSRILYTSETEVNEKETKLPEVYLGAQNNPIVKRSLSIMRKVVNSLREAGKIDADTMITVELARNVNSSTRARAIEKWQLEKKKMYEIYEKELASYDPPIPPTDDNLLRYSLWKEQEEHCPYTGQRISFEGIWKDCDIEHTVPRARGGVSKQTNLTLCYSWYNREVKCNKLPIECPNYDDEYCYNGKTLPPIKLGKFYRKLFYEVERYKKLCKRPRGDAHAIVKQEYYKNCLTKSYWNEKKYFFDITAEKVDAGGFKPRQLVDIGNISKRAVEMLKTRYHKVYCVNGNVTAYARKAWGLQKEDSKKDRDRHIHHAIDAMVIAAIDRARYEKICSDLGNDKKYDYSYVCPPPYKNFGEYIQGAADSILVRKLTKYNQLKRTKYTNRFLANPIRLKNGKEIKKVVTGGTTVRGSLHDDTIYGKIVLNNEPITVIRKKVNEAKNSVELKKWATQAVDASVGQLILNQIDEYEKRSLSSTQIKNAEYKHKNGLPIKSIRIKVTKPKNPSVLRKHDMGLNNVHKNMYSSGSDLLCMDVYENNGRIDAYEVSLLEYVNGLEHVNGVFLYRILPGQHAFVLEKDESKDILLKISHKELQKRLYVINRFEHKKLELLHCIEARRKGVLQEELVLQGKNKTGETDISLKEYNPLLLLSKGVWSKQVIFEGKDFEFTIDGQIIWKDEK